MNPNQRFQISERSSYNEPNVFTCGSSVTSSLQTEHVETSEHCTQYSMRSVVQSSTTSFSSASRFSSVESSSGHKFMLQNTSYPTSFLEDPSRVPALQQGRDKMWTVHNSLDRSPTDVPWKPQLKDEIEQEVEGHNGFKEIFHHRSPFGPQAEDLMSLSQRFSHQFK